MTVPRLLLVTDLVRSRFPLPDLAAEAVAGGVDAIYLRHLTSSDDWAATLGQIRDRVQADVVLMVPAELPIRFPRTGRHLRERDLLPQQSPSGRPVVVSRSVHSPLEAARSIGVNYVVAGHVFPSASKPGQIPLGVNGLASIVAASPAPVVAIGGITPERVAAMITRGAQGVAVIGAVCEAEDPRAAASNLRAAVDAALASHAKGPALTSAQDSETTITITITVNGKPRELAAGSTVHDLLASRKLADSMAIVERNGIILPRDTYATTILFPGDQLEVVHAVGGG